MGGGGGHVVVVVSGRLSELVITSSEFDIVDNECFLRQGLMDQGPTRSM
jgi:hypothetical protein